MKHTEIGLIPSDWEIKELQNVCEAPQYGFTDSAVENGKVKFLRITDIENLRVNWDTVPFCKCPEKKLETYLLKHNDIVFARIGATTGKSYIIKNPPDAVFASYLIRVRTKINLDADFLFYFFNSQEYWKQINSNKGNNLKGGVNGSILKKLLSPLPPLPEQRNIAHILSKIQQAIEAQEKIIAAATELKKAMMQKLFTEGLNGEKQKQTEIGLIPKSWEVKRIGEFYDEEVLEFQNGFPCGKWNENKIGVPQLRPFNISEEGKINLEQVKFIETEKNISNYFLIEEDVIFNNTNSEDLVGKTAIWKNGTGYVLSNHMTIIRIKNKNRLNPLYLSTFIHKKWYDGYFKSICRRHVNQASISTERLKATFIPLPKNIEQQNEIVKILSALENKIEFSQNKKQKLKSLFKTMLNELMTGKIRVKNLEFEEYDPLAMAAEPEEKYNQIKK